MIVEAQHQFNSDQLNALSVPSCNLSLVNQPESSSSKQLQQRTTYTSHNSIMFKEEAGLSATDWRELSDIDIGDLKPLE
jgi:hypothetical protein